MAKCKHCGQQSDELTTVALGGRRKRVCEECAEFIAEEQAIAEESEAAVQSMMGYKGRRS